MPRTALRGRVFRGGCGAGAGTQGCSRHLSPRQGCVGPSAPPIARWLRPRPVRGASLAAYAEMVASPPGALGFPFRPLRDGCCAVGALGPLSPPITRWLLPPFGDGCNHLAICGNPRAATRRQCLPQGSSVSNQPLSSSQSGEARSSSLYELTLRDHVFLGGSTSPRSHSCRVAKSLRSVR